MGQSRESLYLQDDKASDVGVPNSDEPVAVPLTRPVIPLRTKVIAYSMVIFFSTGAFFSENTLGPLKSTFKGHLRITNAQFGAITSATSLINTIVPIIGGIGMDHWGAAAAGIIASAAVLIGAVVSALGTNVNKFALVVCGRIIMGFGSIVLDGAQNKLLAHWFGGSHLGLALASAIAWSRVVTVVAKTTAVPMSQIGSFWGWSLWIPAILCGANVAVCVAYWAFERSLNKEYRPALGSAKSKRITCNSVTQIPRFHWILCITQLFQSAAYITYNSLIADIIRKTRGTTALQAGYTSSVYSVVPIVLTPLVGLFYDQYGYRMWLVPPTGALWLVTFALMGLTRVNPYAPVIIGSVANAFNIVPFVASIPIIVGNDAYLGTAYGIWKCFNTATTIILEVASGAIQDRSPNQSYNRVIYLLMVIKGLQMFWGPFYDWLDGRWLGHMLRVSEKERFRRGEEIRESGKELKGWTVHRPTGIAVATVLGCCIVVGWVLYIIYSLGT